ncbi:lysine N(6)-hydroxylase/L-ornithine N(5)-oxygenase family protein [Serratia inhibens]|uniref:lysine N(6)-hydroxylase/L-ornithine N(5)-oxygenase family protein n=1 Tax=Serratia inhibens TaxID=2338073 RepID=UPI0032174C42
MYMTEHYQCVGVGCGPSNLSMAALLHGNKEIKSIFFDAKKEFSWHDGMMMRNSDLQVSLFKDLVTLADPCNKFSFISYLHQHNRLYQFLNARFEQMSRQEFRGYLKWVSENNENVIFGEKVLNVEFKDDVFHVETSQRSITSENVVIGVGTQPNVPEFVSSRLNDSNHFHVNSFASRDDNFVGKHVVVIGGGQSGAEAVLDLIQRQGTMAPAVVTWISRRENFFPLDDSSFTNDFYSPAHSNYFFEQEKEYRDNFLSRNILSSDGVSESTLRMIYQRIYTLKYVTDEKMVVNLLPYREVYGVNEINYGWCVAVKHLADNSNAEIPADVVVWASGFKPASLPFLKNIRECIEQENNEIKIDKHYAAIWNGPSNNNIFLLNAARTQRGLSDPNLSLIAWRSQTVINRMIGSSGNSTQNNSSFVSWGQCQKAIGQE